MERPLSQRTRRTKAPRGGARWLAPLALGAGLAAGGLGACALPGFQITGSSGTGGSGGTGATAGSMGGSGASMSSQGGTGGQTSSGAAGTGAGDTGGAPGCNPCLDWVTPYYGGGEEHALAVSVDSSGHAELGGTLTSLVDFGTKAIACAGATDGYAVHTSPAGKVDAAFPFAGDAPNPGNQWVRAVATTSDGSSIVAGTFYDQVIVDPGAGTKFTSKGSGTADGFVAKYDGAGMYLWGVQVGGAFDDHVTAIALDSKDNVVIVGSFQGTCYVANTPVMVQAGGGPDAFVAKLAASTGQVMWTGRVGGKFSDTATAVAVHSSDDITVVGNCEAAIAYENNAPAISGFAQDVFALRVDKDGGYGWLREFGGTGAQAGLAVAAAPDGAAYIAGSFSGDLTLDKPYSFPAAGPDNTFLARLEPTKGDPTWSQVLPGVSPVSQPPLGAHLGLAAMPKGGVVLAGSFAAPTDFGDGAVVAPDGIDAFILRLGPQHEHLWHEIINGQGLQSANAAAVDGAGAIVVAGDFTTEAKFGPGIPMASGSADIFLLKIKP